MSAARFWHVLPGRHWPMLTAQEETFVAALAARVPEGARMRFDRDDVSVLMSALRCGTDLDVLLEVAPRVNTVRLYAAYRRLDALRLSSVDAWKRIESSPDPRSIRENAEAAKVLLPVPVGRVVQRLTTGSRDDVARVVADVAAELRKTRVMARSLEAELAEIGPNDSRGVEIGAKLYDPHHPGLWASPFFCPDRVGALTPLRLRDVLSERS